MASGMPELYLPSFGTASLHYSTGLLCLVTEAHRVSGLSRAVLSSVDVDGVRLEPRTFGSRVRRLATRLPETNVCCKLKEKHDFTHFSYF